MTVTATARFGVYRLFDANDALLYVGFSSTPVARVSEHRGTLWGAAIDSMTVEWFPERRQALEVETAAILAEGPLYNKRRSVDSDPVRTVRVSDGLWGVSQDTAWSRRETVSGAIRKGLDAYNADPDAFDKACSRITGKVER